jgi:hypothetical protein
MTETKTIKMSVNLNTLLIEAAREMRSPGIAIGFQITMGCLRRIALRAIEIKDKAILEELDTLGIITMGEDNDDDKG